MLAEMSQLQKLRRNMTYDDHSDSLKSYQPYWNDRNELRILDEDLMELHMQLEQARDKYQAVIPLKPIEIGHEIFVKDLIAHFRNLTARNFSAEVVAKICETVRQIT